MEDRRLEGLGSEAIRHCSVICSGQTSPRGQRDGVLLPTATWIDIAISMVSRQSDISSTWTNHTRHLHRCGVCCLSASICAWQNPHPHNHIAAFASSRLRARYRCLSCVVKPWQPYGFLGRSCDPANQWKTKSPGESKYRYEAKLGCKAARCSQQALARRLCYTASAVGITKLLTAAHVSKPVLQWVSAVCDALVVYSTQYRFAPGSK
ncbi:hypothetical protein CONLIGDRAFT_522266 [Coniochaeta ligniaria NRRL 30616]|uniref:Uncharacterized protein n=1 Tax=Coniochaeta ligniaria NRRL 30616 TaxID=1408157 RepID=A0A1J7J8S0_9PEZI|nr:hypothetical protein CONLIGDRAFT_522266 [Coniochaeta ligniaria NRRL 30616]